MKLLGGLQAWLTGLCGVSMAVAWALNLNWLAVASVVLGGAYALEAAWKSLRHRSLDVNFLMVFAAVGAVVVKRPIEAAALLFLFSLSGTLEAYTMAKTRRAIEGMVKLRPERCLRIRGAEEELVAVEELELGDHVRLPPHESIPTDGVVISGSSSVDQASMTGESRPVSRTAGDALLGGTINLQGMLVMEVRARVADSTLSRIVELVQDAQENKASGERISTWFGERYTWFVLAAFALSWGIRLALGQAQNEALYASLVLLVALSPCALVISTPATTLSALAYAARRGMLVRGGRFIELAGSIRAIALDKTGTLTLGKPRLAEICVCHGHGVAVGGDGSCRDEDSCWAPGKDMSVEAGAILAAAASVEQYSTHPIAQAIEDAARERGIPLPQAEDHEAIPGFGVTAKVGGVRMMAGRREMFDLLGVQPPRDFLPHAEKMAANGMTVALVTRDHEFAALGIRDEPRANAREVVDELRALGVGSVVMVTGDNETTARAVGDEVGIERIHASLLPDRKEAVVREMCETDGPTMMVGDGINDAPSLAKATLGVAMGGLGSDIALNAADVVLMHDDLARLPELIRLGRLTNRIVRTNLLFASGVIVALAAGSLSGYLKLPLAVLGHEGSTVLVILNGLRLLHGPGRSSWVAPRNPPLRRGGGTVSGSSAVA